MGFEFNLTVNTDMVKSASKAAIRRALKAVGEFLASEASDALEMDPRRVDSHTLQDSITSEYVPAEQAVYVGTNVEYAIYVHEGTRRMAPNRFLKNAFEMNADQVKQYVEEALKNG